MNIGYGTHDSNMPYTAVLSFLQFLKDHPEYCELMKKLKLTPD